MVLAGASLTASAQTGSYVPKHEFGVNLFGGISSLQYDIDGFDHKLGMGGGFGFSYIYHFNDQWGLLTGLQGAYYQGKAETDNFWTTEAFVSPTRSVTLKGFGYDMEEKQNAMHLQIPIMVQNMIPMGKHHFYWAAGVKVGIRLTDKYKQKGTITYGEGEVGTWYGPIINAKTRAAAIPNTVDPTLWDQAEYINPRTHYAYVGNLAYEMNGTTGFDPYDPDEFKADEKLDMKAFNMTASAEVGFRWALNEKMGLYTGLYLDYGFLNCRPDLYVADMRDKESVWAQGFLSQADLEYVGMDGQRPQAPMSILTGATGDYVRATEFAGNTETTLYDPEIINKRDALADRLSTLGFGLNLRLTFGAAPAAPKPVVIKQPVVTPPDPEEIPVDINAKMRELSNTLFAFDKFDLNDKAKGYLDEIADWLKENPNLNVEIAGHTDSKGTDEYNQKLSENRAKSVYEYFISKGVKANRLSYKGYGESMPIATNDTDEGRQLNRRVELKIVK